MDNEDLTYKIMQEIGLEVDKYGRVIDQDTNGIVQYRGKIMKIQKDENTYIGRKDIRFDPANDQKMMNHLFGYYVDKLQNSGEQYVSAYYPVSNSGKSAVEVKGDNNIIKSKYYNNSSLGYVDAIMRLNGDDNVDLSQFDSKNK